MNEFPDRVIALTGSMGSGKSAVTSFFCDTFVADRIDVDRVCRLLLQPDEAGWRLLRKYLHSDYFASDGSLDRVKLRKAIFSDDAFRLRINEMIHPLARKYVARLVQQHLDSKSENVVVVEVPLLFEAGWASDFATTIVVYACARQCRRRIATRDGVTDLDARKAVASQSDLLDKALLADHVIDNSGTWFLTCMQVLRLGRLLGAVDRKRQ